MSLSVETLGFRGKGLCRPECVLAHSSGALLVPDWTGSGGVSVIRPDGGTARLLSNRTGEPIRPNGIALEAGGSVLLAHLGAEMGGLFRLWPDGGCEPFLTEIDGRVLPPSNFVLADGQGRLWLTVSTRQIPRDRAYRADVADGFIVLMDASGARIVADGLGFANECALSEDGATLYVNETFARRTLAFDVDFQGRLGGKRIVARYGRGTFPDGLALDDLGGLWITSIISNRLIRVDPEKNASDNQEIMIEDADPDHIAWVEAAYQSHEIGRPHLDTVAGRVLRNISNCAFGGPDLGHVHMGSLAGDAIAGFESQYTGVEPSHWDADISGILSRAVDVDPEDRA